MEDVEAGKYVFAVDLVVIFFYFDSSRDYIL